MLLIILLQFYLLLFQIVYLVEILPSLFQQQLQQAQITSDKVKAGRDLLTQSIDLQVQQANITLTNSLQTLETQQRNVDLAQEVVRVSKIKYQEGVGSNIEVINAESSLKEAQTNYFAALYDVLIAKVDLSKARGELYEE